MAQVDNIKAAACTSGIGKLNSEVDLLQTIAQLEADIASSVAGVDVTPAQIASRACTSGIGKVNDPIVLLQIIAQLLNDQQ